MRQTVYMNVIHSESAIQSAKKLGGGALRYSIEDPVEIVLPKSKHVSIPYRSTRFRRIILSKGKGRFFVRARFRLAFTGEPRFLFIGAPQFSRSDMKSNRGLYVGSRNQFKGKIHARKPQRESLF